MHSIYIYVKQFVKSFNMSMVMRIIKVYTNMCMKISKNAIDFISCTTSSRCCVKPAQNKQLKVVVFFA